MAKRRSAAHLARYQFQPRASAPVVVRTTRVVKQKQKRRRHGGGGGGGGMGIGQILAAELALQVAEPMVMGLVARLPIASTLPQPVVVALVAHYAKADKYVRGVQLLTKVEAVKSLMTGGLAGMFQAPPTHG